MKKYCIQPDADLLTCMKVIDRTSSGIAIAVDENSRLIGTVSDGDIRRALIRGADIHDPVHPYINRSCFSVLPSVNRAEVLDIMHSRRFEQVPIVDEDNTVIGLHILHDIIGNRKRPNKAVIMAGGKGTRLRPITKDIPKPMVQVAGRPILERIILHLVNYGIHRIFLAVNYLAHIIEDYFGDGSRFGCKIEYLREEKPLGSGGAVSLLAGSLEDSLLLMNGDLIIDADFSKLIDFHEKNQFYATMGIYPYFHEVPYGCVEFEDNKLTGLEEKPVLQKFINAGLYILSPGAVQAIPKQVFFPITHLFEKAIQDNLKCGVFHIEKDWIDIGNPDHLKKARGDV